MKNQKLSQTQNNYFQICSLFILLTFTIPIIPHLNTLAAPDPAPSSQKDAQTFQTLRSKEGFLFSQLDTTWFNSPTPKDKKSMHLLFRSPVVNQGFQPIMTVRVDNNIGEIANINQYVQQWMGDYPRLGYQVLGSRPFRHNNREVSYVIDIKNERSQKQIRQVVFFKRRQKAVILNCIDNIASFMMSLRECNKIIRSFAWTSDLPETPGDLEMQPPPTQAN